MSLRNKDKGDLILSVDNLSVDYKTRTARVSAVKDVSFELFRGETYGLVGESGCGKSTVAFAVMGYTARNGQLSKGNVRFKGKEMTTMSQKDLKKIWGAEISMVYQDPDSALNPSIRIGEQVSDVLQIHGKLSAKEARGKAISLFEVVHLTDPQAISTRFPHQLSGGMKQRVCIAMALAAEPDLLIMDEPTTALDVTTEATILDLIQELKEKFNTAILYITHNLGVVARICDRVGVMYLGKLVKEADVWKLFKTPRHPYTIALLNCIPKLGDTKSTKQLFSIQGNMIRSESLSDGCTFFNRCAFYISQCMESQNKLVEIEPGHRTSCNVYEQFERTQQKSRTDRSVLAISRSSRNQGELLQVDHLHHYYLMKSEAFLGALFEPTIKIKAVDDVSFNLEKDRTLAIVGESGCGKTTLARCVAGFLKPMEGSILFEGLDLAVPIEKRTKEMVRKITIVFQNPDATLNPKHSVGYAISRPLQLRNGFDVRQIRDEVIRSLKAVNLDSSYLDRMPRELSGGEKQRVAIARAFATGPELVICDEPTSALDVSVQASILTLLLDLQTQMGLSYLFISHDLSVVWYISDYIAVMYLGKICEIGMTSEIFLPPYHPYTEALLSAIPIPDPEARQKQIRLVGRVPSLINPPLGCRFNTRCPRKIGNICETESPPKVKVSETHKIYCHISIDHLKQVPPVFLPSNPGKGNKDG